jgi:hypothetical protein
MSWYSDGRRRMIAILIAERPWTSPSPPHVCLNFWSSASQLIDNEKIPVDVSISSSLARLYVTPRFISGQDRSEARLPTEN